MSQTIPADSVRIVLTDEAKPDNFLILAESDEPDVHKLPGGKLQEGESPLDAAHRELFEEVGLTPEDVMLGAVGVLFNQRHPSLKRHIFKGIVAKEAILPTSEVAQIDWVTRDTIPEGENQGHILAAVDFAQSEPAQLPYA